MTYRSTHVFLGVTLIDYSLAYVASICHTIKGTKIAAQNASVTIEAITIEVNAKCHNLLGMCLTKFDFASCFICTLKVAVYALDQIDLNNTSFYNQYDLM